MFVFPGSRVSPSSRRDLGDPGVSPRRRRVGVSVGVRCDLLGRGSGTQTPFDNRMFKRLSRPNVKLHGAAKRVAIGVMGS